MCGRYTIFNDQENQEIMNMIDEVNRRHNVEVKTGEIYPTDLVPIITDLLTVNVVPMKWGFPRWDGKGVVINARSETVTEKKMFAESISKRRCIVPSTGFYEWQKKDDTKKKDKYLFNFDDSKVLYMTGIYQKIKDIDYFVILTENANESISDIHDRMPVCLDKKDSGIWMSDAYAIILHREDTPILKRDKEI